MTDFAVLKAEVDRMMEGSEVAVGVIDRLSDELGAGYAKGAEMVICAAASKGTEGDQG